MDRMLTPDTPNDGAKESIAPGAAWGGVSGLRSQTLDARERVSVRVMELHLDAVVRH
jgi:hypothetical protein